MWLKLRTGDDDEDVFAEFQGNTKDVLERALVSCKTKYSRFLGQPIRLRSSDFSRLVLSRTLSPFASPGQGS